MSDEEIKAIYSDCTLCPRNCHINRSSQPGFCGAGAEIKLARAALHIWEEPCLTGAPEGRPEGAVYGSGAVFFSNCALKCVFCQNHEISSGGFGLEVSPEKLADIMLRLKDEGAANIDLISASHYIPSLIRALDKVKYRLGIPVVFNCSGYESLPSLKMLEGYIDIYLPDLKYYSEALAVKYSSAPHYFETAMAAVKEMIRQTGSPVMRPQSQTDASAAVGTEPEKALLIKGTLIRHMVLPGCRRDSIELLEHIAGELAPGSYLISLLSQYTPFYRASKYPELSRRISSFEYDSVLKRALILGMDGYMQEKSSAKEEYTPSFRLEGVY